MSAVASHHSQNADRRFIRKAMHASLLSAERERMLAEAWRRDGDEAALHELINAYTRLVVALAGRYRHYGLPVSDLVQEGLVGLMQAAGRFEPAREVRFSTYASWWVRAAVQDFILRNWSIVRTGTTAAQKTLFFNLRRLRAQIGHSSDGPLAPEGRQRIARELDIREADVERMDLRLSGADQSLNRPLGEEGDHDWQDMLPDERATPEQTVLEMRDSVTRAGWLAAALQGLTPRERMIVARRRLAEDGVTLESLGQVLGISKERVRQIEHQALTKMRAQIEQDAGLAPGQRMEF